MSIIRGKRPDSKFYTLDKSISEDLRLSWAARGLLIFLLGKPDHWEVSVAHLIKQTAEAIGKSSGRDAVRQLLKELEQAGYLRASQARADGGVFSGVDYIVSEQPQPFSPETENPSPVNPAPVNPLQVNNDLEVKTDLEANNQLTARKSGDLLAGDKAQSSAARKPKTKKPNAKTAMPEGFAPSDGHKAMAAAAGLDLVHEFQQFSDHHAAKGTLFKDWGAALRTWLRNAKKFTAQRPAPARARTGYIDQSAMDYSKGVDADGNF